MTRHRSSVNGRFVSPEKATSDPAGTVSESVKQPDLEAGAEAFYLAWVTDGLPYRDLGQEYRDRLRHALREALQAL